MKLQRLWMWSIGLLAVGGAMSGIRAFGTGEPPDPLSLPDRTEPLVTHIQAAGVVLARFWEDIVANPGPTLLALATFAVTVIFHVRRGTSFRESIEAAANVDRPPHYGAPPHRHEPTETEKSPVVARASARALRNQLIADQIQMEQRLRAINVTDLKQAEQGAARAQQALADARRNLDEKIAHNSGAAGALASLRCERARLVNDLSMIQDELGRLAAVV